ncbi:MAG: efflux RND transporter periplasmic adaptor subunit [Candidatus Goldbacteria bacterium]|nr:efflux RND transporter periplasmic adaptor subunit [Candidatus Goldiibacteriota bacterium]
MDKKIKNMIIISILIILSIILFQIIKKLILVSGKQKEIEFEVLTEKIQLKEITEILKFEGIAEGDPQVKVYSQVPGKFEKNLVAEGDYVKKDTNISYINRDIIGFDYNFAPVKSPIDGVVIKLFFTDKGDTVLPQMPVAEIANIENIKIIINTGENDLNKVKKENKAIIFSSYDKNIKLEGKIFSVTPFINKDTLSGTIIVKAKNENKKIKPGQSVTVTIETDKRKTFWVPFNSVLTDDVGTYIYINDNSKAKKIYINTGYTEGDYIEIFGDLKEGMEIVTDGSFKLFENAKLKIKQVN